MNSESEGGPCISSDHFPASTLSCESQENELNNLNFIKKSAEEKDYLQRPSFKVEEVLTHHLNSDHPEGKIILRVLLNIILQGYTININH